MELNIQKLDNRSEEDSKQYDEKDLKYQTKNKFTKKNYLTSFLYFFFNFR